jgi:hypothetical protein
MQQAYDYMILLISSGVEYPDAEWKAAHKFGVSSDELRNMYDSEGVPQ